MKFAHSQFEQISRSHPEWTSWTCFCETIKARGYKKSVIKKKFLELVDKEDWRRNNEKELLEYLGSI